MSIYNYYVYCYLRKDATPYYIGKGRDNRAFVKHGKMPVPKDKSKIVFLETNLSEVGALALERRYIRWYGRKDNHTGILRNLTDGGEGCSGIICSEKTKQKISIANKGRPHSEEAKQKMSIAKKGMPAHNKGKPAHNKGKPHSEEAKQKMSITRKGKPAHNKGKPAHNKGKPGKPHSEEAKQKISIANKGRPSPLKGRPRSSHSVDQ